MGRLVSARPLPIGPSRGQKPAPTAIPAGCLGAIALPAPPAVAAGHRTGPAMDNPLCCPAPGAAGRGSGPAPAPLSEYRHTWRPMQRGTFCTVGTGTHPPAGGQGRLTTPRAAGTTATALGGPSCNRFASSKTQASHFAPFASHNGQSKRTCALSSCCELQPGQLEVARMLWPRMLAAVHSATVNKLHKREPSSSADATRGAA